MFGSERPPAALAHHTGFLMNWVSLRTREQFARALHDAVDLHPRDFGALSVIAANEGLMQQALALAAGIDPSTMVATLDGLEARGLAERRPHPTDRRKRAVHLTEAGRQTLRAGQKVAGGVSAEAFGALSATERDELNRLLRKLSGVAETPKAGGPAGAAR